MLPRDNIRLLAQTLGETFFVSEAARVLRVNNQEASKALYRWEKQGWLKHICKGYFSIVPLDAISQHQPLENMWTIVPDLFSPGYIGGWSAAEHWDFTEQIFQDTCVLTQKRVSPSLRHQQFLGINFCAFHIPKKLNFGTELIWIKHKKVYVSDPHKTIIDMLYKPVWGGGIQHTIDCFKVYLTKDYLDQNHLIHYAHQMKNGVVFKRLGYLAEKLLSPHHDLTETCFQHRTMGPSYLDTSNKAGDFHKKWQLYASPYLQI